MSNSSPGQRSGSGMRDTRHRSSLFSLKKKNGH
jgi:hypothetical protein